MKQQRPNNNPTNIFSHYRFENYLQMPRWNSYWHQVDETLAFHPETALIVGAGDNLVGKILETYGVRISTLDTDESLNPDFHGNITDADAILHGQRFDVALCCQVLEHLPFDLFAAALQKLSAAAPHVILSLPYVAGKYGFEIRLPPNIHVAKYFYVQKLFKTWQPSGEHLWEVGYKGFSRQKITRIIQHCFTVEKIFVAQNNPYHLFFILSC
jgi:hypothetical protein